MFKDVVTYCPSLASLREELARLKMIDEEGEPTLQLTKTPLQYSDPEGKTLALIRIVEAKNQEVLDSLECLEVLGTYEEVFADPAKMGKYTSVYSIDPIKFVDEEGVEQTYEPPKKFGVFA